MVAWQHLFASPPWPPSPLLAPLNCAIQPQRRQPVPCMHGCAQRSVSKPDDKGAAGGGRLQQSSSTLSGSGRLALPPSPPPISGLKKVLAGDPQTSNDGNKAEAQPKGHTGKTVLFVLLGVGAVIVLSFFIFKYWQKKKREEQHARLLKLFEEDDDIEVELGLRD